MRTTIRLRDDLLRRAKKHAAEDHRTFTSVVEEGLTLVLAKSTNQRRSKVIVPVSRASGGVLPGVDLNRSTELLDVMDAS